MNPGGGGGRGSLENKGISMPSLLIVSSFFSFLSNYHQSYPCSS